MPLATTLSLPLFAAGGQHLPNFVDMLFHGVEDHTRAWIVNGAYSFMAMAMILGFLRLATRNLKVENPGRLQTLAELLIAGLGKFFGDIAGDQAKKFVPYLVSVFLFIIVMNFMGLVPGLHSPTSTISMTATLALITFALVQYHGLKNLGIKGFVNHLLGEPDKIGPIGWVLAPLMLVLHVIGEIARPAALALRLFGNISGEDVLLWVFCGLGIIIAAGLVGADAENMWFGIPLQAVVYPLILIFSTLQATVFTLLSAVYFALYAQHDDHH